MTLTDRQRAVIKHMMPGSSYTAERIGVRRDVMWRLEGKGLIASNAGDRFWLTKEGQAVNAILWDEAP